MHLEELTLAGLEQRKLPLESTGLINDEIFVLPHTYNQSKNTS